MLNRLGEPCGIDATALAEKLGVGSVKIEFCSTTMSEYGTYNRTWQCRAPSVRMYDRGSIFKLICDRAPALAAVQEVQQTGLGIRRAEGYGQVVFLPAELFEGLHEKRPLQKESGGSDSAPKQAVLRRAKYQWVMEHSDQVMTDGLSKSQVGTIQSLCEKAMAVGNTKELDTFFEKNLNDRGAHHGSRFEKISRLVQDVLDEPLSKTLNISCEDTERDRLALLCLLFNYCRKGREKEEM
jgi:hypothetical protein